MPKVLPEGTIYKYGSWTRATPPHESPSDDFMTRRLYSYWAVPSDGRVQLGFTKEGLGCAEDWQERIKAVEHFIADLAKIGAKFYIVDDGLEYSQCRFQIVPEPGEDPQKLIQQVQHEGLYG